MYIYYIQKAQDALRIQETNLKELIWKQNTEKLNLMFLKEIK